MERNLNNREFEEFLKQNADQYRMFPSEKVWKDIHSALHPRRRWYSLGLALLLLTSATVTYVMLSSTGPVNTGPARTLAGIQKASEISANKLAPENILVTTPITTGRTIPFNAGIANPSTEQLISGAGFTNETDVQSRPVENEVLIPVSTAVVAKTQAPVRFYQPLVYQAARMNEKISMSSPIAYTSTIQDNVPDPKGYEESMDKEVKTTNSEKLISEYPMTIESVVNSYRPLSSRKKISWQIYFAPTVSYRRLKENNEFRSSALASPNSFVYPVLSDINNAVTHKPDMGIELGFNAGFPVTKVMSFTAGLQFNVSKYDIRAFAHPQEFTTIALSTASGRPSAVSTVSSYRNFSGQKESWLHNLYTSVSLPIGMQFRLPTTSKTYVGLGGNVQPTYILGERAYLISTDFKNYAEVPWLIRRINLATNVEIFAGFSTKNIKWKVGPQMRYQWLSSFEDKYPVKEHLFDFGLKVGVLLNQ